MLGRFFPGNWRPPVDEIRFASENGFAALQIRTDAPGEIARDLRADLGEVGGAFAKTSVEPVVEMLLRLSDYPSIAAALEANLAALAELGCRRVHVHPVPGAPSVDVAALEQDLPRLFSEAVEVAEGGPGFDSDDALRASQARLRADAASATAPVRRTRP
jgi:hypothetical protein